MLRYLVVIPVMSIPLLIYYVFELYDVICEIHQLEDQFRRDLIKIKENHLLANLWGNHNPVLLKSIGW